MEVESHGLRLDQEAIELVCEQARIHLERLRVHHGRGVLAGRVCRLAPVVDPARGTRTAVVQFPSAGRQALPGTAVPNQLMEE